MKNEQTQIFELAHYAFQFEKSETYQNRLNYLLSHSKHYGSYDEDRLVSQVIATPLKVHFFDQLFDMSGIGFVSSDPGYRGEGRIDQLMSQMLSDCQEQGVTLSYLAPFSYPFYRRYGYELVFERISYQLPSHQWPDSKKGSGHVRRQPWEEAKEIIKNIYETSNRKNQGGLHRENWWYEYKFHIQRPYYFAVYYNAAGEAEGYLVYQIKDGLFDCAEWEFLTGEAYTGLNRYIATHKESVREIRYEQGYNKNSGFFLNETPLAKAVIRPEMMVRIVDLQQFMQRYPLEKLERSFAFVIEEDRYAPWNQGIFEIDAVTKEVRKVKSSVLPQVKGTIQRLTQLLLGYQTLQELLFFDQLTVDEEIQKTVTEILPKQVPVLEDYF
ncbi:GNAT family N-acetyltransferase [Enterococcus olivae]